jgi:hypothetical protein
MVYEPTNVIINDICMYGSVADCIDKWAISQNLYVLDTKKLSLFRYTTNILFK